jgi:hypothetical protein
MNPTGGVTAFLAVMLRDTSTIKQINAALRASSLTS